MTGQSNDLPEAHEQSFPRTIKRRTVLKSTAALLGASAVAGVTPATGTMAEQAQAPAPATPLVPKKGQIGFVLSHEQFPVTDLVQYAKNAERAGFDTLWTSDHFQPWMENEGHEGLAWVTLSAVGAQTTRIPFGTAVTCPTYRYNPAIVAQAFATLGMLYPGRVFLGVGSGEALNEQSATTAWGPWQERSDRLVEAVDLIRKLWSGQTIDFQGKFFHVQNSRLYDVPNPAVPIYMAANGKKSMYRAGQYGDGLITDSKTLMNYKDQFEAGVRASGRDPANIPILVESFVVVGGQAEAELSAALWRFIPKAWTTFVNEPDPRRILHRAEVEQPLEEVYKDWPVSTDPAVHAQALQKLFDMGATQVYVHSGHPDQQRTISFYGQSVLPRMRGGRS